MGVFSRVFRLCKADLHGVMDQLEDKELLLKQCLREMEESLKDKHARLDGIMRACERIQRALARHNEESVKLEQDLDLAVGKEKDEIARMLIRKRRTLQAGCAQLRRRLETLAEERDQVAGTLDNQRLQYDQLKAQAAAFCRRDEQRRFEEPLEALNGDSVWPAPSEEEIELELLQRKEAARKEGAS
jgi:phage shock protein A